MLPAYIEHIWKSWSKKRETKITIWSANTYYWQTDSHAKSFENVDVDDDDEKFIESQANEEILFQSNSNWLTDKDYPFNQTNHAWEVSADNS